MSENTTESGQAHIEPAMNIKSLLQRIFKAAEDQLKSDTFTNPLSIQTKFPDLDTLLIGGGLPQGGFTVVAGEPGSGKTSFAQALVNHGAIEDHIPTLYFSPALTKERWAPQTLCQVAGVKYERLQSMRLQDSDWVELTDAVDKMCDAPFWFDDTPAVNIEDICQRSRKLKESHDIRQVIIDNLQLIETEKLENRQAELDYISRRLKALAAELSISVVALSTLNRGRLLRKPRDRRPILSDLRGAGSIEDYADLVLFIHILSMSCSDCLDTARTCEIHAHGNTDAEIIVAKQSGGMVGTAYLLFEKSFPRFSTLNYEDA